MTQQQLITKIKEKIREIQQLIINQEQEIKKNKNIFLNLLEELNNIESNMKNKQD